MKTASANACDFVILAAQQEEVVALTKLTGSAENLAAGGVVYRRVSIPVQAISSRSTNRDVKGAIVTIGGMGRVSAAISASKVLHTFSPQLLILVGVAGGFEINGVELGDIVVAETIVDYEEQRLTDTGVEYRFKNFDADKTMLKVSRDAIGPELHTSYEIRRKHQPRIHFGPILSGDKVFASRKVSSIYLDLNPKLLGVEMEGAGVAATIKVSARDTRFLMIRGIVDFADEQKQQQADAWFERACDALASYTIAVIAKFYN